MADETSDPAALMSGGQSPWTTFVKFLGTLQTGRLADAVMAGAVMALLLAMMLGKVKGDVTGALFSLCLILVLVALAAFDLIVRWDDVDLQRPDHRGPRWQTGWARLFRNIWPEVVLVAGIVVGHVLWRG